MKLVSLLLALLLAWSPTADARAQTSPDDIYAFLDVSVVPMDHERVVRHQTVVVREGKIAAVGPTDRMPIPEGATSIDGQGKYLMPGLAEMHAHIPRWDQSREFAERVLFLYLANGVTTIRGMLGHRSHLELRQRVRAGELWSPRIWTSGPSVNGNSVQTVTAAEQAATEQKAAGYDFIKIHPGLKREVFDALDAAADREGIRFSGHVPTDVGLERALEAGYASIDHLDGYIYLLVADDAQVDLSAEWGFFGVNLASHVDESKIPAVAAATRDARVWNVPTQTLMENFASEESVESLLRREGMRYMPQRTLEGWENRWNQWRNASSSGSAETAQRFIDVRRQLIKALQDAGAGLLLGSDAPQVWNVPGFSALRELQALVAAGLTPYEALKAGTHNVAIFFGTTDEAGTVEVGKNADLILLDANPLADISNVKRQAGVMIGGRWMSREMIEARLAVIAARNN